MGRMGTSHSLDSVHAASGGDEVPRAALSTSKGGLVRKTSNVPGPSPDLVDRRAASSLATTDRYLRHIAPQQLIAAQSQRESSGNG